MIPSEELCGRCGQPYYAKSFRQAEILVCQGCNTVTLQKADFKRLITGAIDVDARPAPRPSTPAVSEPVVTRAPAAGVPAAPASPAPSISPRAPSGRAVPVTAGAPAPRAPSRPRFDDEPSLGPLATEVTDAYTRGPDAGTMAPTEIDGVAEPVFDLAPAGFVQPSFHIGAPLKSAPSRPGPAVVPDPAPVPVPERAPVGDFEIDGPERELPELELDVDDGFDDALAEYQARRAGAWVPVLLGVGLLGLVVAGLAGVWASGLLGGATDRPVAEPASAAPQMAPVPVVDPVPTPTEVPAVVPVPSPEVTPASPEPAPAAPSPAPAAAGPAPTGLSGLVKQGWAAFERSPAEAEVLFGQALALRADHADANYGYGYALLKQGRTAQATPYLCKARDGGDAEISRDIRSLLSQNGLACN